MKSFLLPLALFIAAAQAQFIIGAIALIEFTLEILEAEAVVATVEVSVDVAITGSEAAETAAITGDITNVATTVTRVGEEGVELEGEATMTGFRPVALSGPGATQGTFTYTQPYPVGVGRGQALSVRPKIELTFSTSTSGVRAGSSSRINFSNPTINNPRISNLGGSRGTSIRVKGNPFTTFLAAQ